MFSSREVMKTPKVTELYIRVPVPENYSARFFKGGDRLLVETIPLQFLPPVEVRLVPAPEEECVPYIATICCDWLTFKQKSIVGALLDGLWDKSKLLEENIETFLNEGAAKILKECKILDCLDLMWLIHTPLHPNVIRRNRPHLRWSQRAQRVKRIPKNLIIETASFHPKGLRVIPHLVTHEEKELKLGSVAGTACVECIIGSLCTNNVIPTRMLKLKGCETPHFICNQCAFQYLLSDSTKLYPHCPAYCCGGTFEQDQLWELTCHDATAFQKLGNLILEEELFLHARDIYMFCCPNPTCKKEVRPRTFITTYGMTLCPFCDTCWCETCSKGDEGCKVQMGLQICENPGKREQMMEQRGELFTQQVITAFNEQMHVTYEIQACPRCFTGIQKMEGCNKILCKCGQPFCYQCGEPLDRLNPYHHYELGRCTVHD